MSGQTKKQIDFIINPISGTGKHKSVVAAVNSIVNKQEIEYNLYFTTGPGHATQISKQSALEGKDAVIAVGGDGTMHEVAKGLVGEKTAMGIIPKGSGNGLARNLNIPMKLEKSIEVICDCKTIKVDTVKINDNAFFGIAGVGFDALIAQRFAEYGKRGLQSYIKLALSEYAKFRSPDFQIEVDGVKYHRSGFLISFANSGQFGNNATISPHASMQDGLIDVCIMKDFPAHRAPEIAARIFTNSIDKSRYLEVIRGKEIIVEQMGRYVHLDGEPCEMQSPLKMTVNPRSLNVIIPGNKTGKRLQQESVLIETIENSEKNEQ